MAPDFTLLLIAPIGLFLGLTCGGLLLHEAVRWLIRKLVRSFRDRTRR